MANSDPSHDQWPPLLASQSKMQPPPAKSSFSRSAQPMAASGHTPTTTNLPPLLPLEPPDPCRSTQPSFAAIARPKPVFRFPPISIPSKPRTLKDGKPAVTFTASELQPGIQRLQHSIIAKFTAGRPHIDDIRRCFASAWSIADLDSIGAIDARHILIITSSEEDSNKILAHPLRKVGQSLFRLFRWSPDFHRRREPTTTITWIKLPGLPNQLYDQGYLYTIVSQFSRFIAIDHRTRVVSNPSFARVCIELDLNKPIPEEVWIGLPNSDGFWQSITYENKLLYCSRCKLHGHDLSNCRKTKPMSAAPELTGLSNQVNPNAMAFQDKPDDFDLPIGKPNGVAPQEKHEKVKPLSRNKKDNITCSSEQNEAGWKMVKKRKGKLTNVEIQPPSSPLDKQTSALATLKEIDSDTSHKALTDGMGGPAEGENEDNPKTIPPVSDDAIPGNISLEGVVETVTQLDNDVILSNPGIGDTNTQDTPRILDQSPTVQIAKSIPICSANRASEYNDQHKELCNDVNSDGVSNNNFSPDANKVEVPVGIDGSANTEDEHNEEMQNISDSQITEESAQKISSYGSKLFCCKDFEGPVDARAMFLHYKARGENEKIIFEDLDKAFQPFQQKNRHRKKKNSRASARDCPKKKDTNFVWS